jgi:hypothetical protein
VPPLATGSAEVPGPGLSGETAAQSAALAILQRLMDGLGATVVTGFCQCYCGHLDAWLGGLPDLLLWRNEVGIWVAYLHCGRPAIYARCQYSDSGACMVAKWRHDGPVGRGEGTWRCTLLSAGVRTVASHPRSTFVLDWLFPILNVSFISSALEMRQHAWIDRLLAWGASVIVCHVET